MGDVKKLNAYIDSKTSGIKIYGEMSGVLRIITGRHVWGEFYKYSKSGELFLPADVYKLSDKLMSHSKYAHAYILDDEWFPTWKENDFILYENYVLRVIKKMPQYEYEVELVKVLYDNPDKVWCGVSGLLVSRTNAHYIVEFGLWATLSHCYFDDRTNTYKLTKAAKKLGFNLTKHYINNGNGNKILTTTDTITYKESCKLPRLSKNSIKSIVALDGKLKYIVGEVEHQLFNITSLSATNNRVKNLN